MVKNIYVFDMGKVITKPSKLYKMYDDSMMHLHCPFSDFKHYFYDSEEAKASYKGLMSDDDFFEYLRNITKSYLTASQLRDLYYQNKGGLYLDTINIIRRLKDAGASVNLLSNLREVDYEYLKENVDIHLFDQMFLSYKLGMVKPDEEIFRHAIETLGTNNFHFFDDSERNIMVAKSLGIDAHQVTGKTIVKCFEQLKA